MVPRSALSRLIRFAVMKVKLPAVGLPMGSWSIPASDGISAWSRRPTMGSRLKVTDVGAVTVKRAAVLAAPLWPPQSSSARNCAPLSLMTVVGL